MIFKYGTPLQHSCLEKPGRLQSMGSRRVGHDWVTSLSLFTFMHWRRKWQLTPVFLPGESQGWGELGGLPSMGPHRVGHDWSDLAVSVASSPIVSMYNFYCLPILYFQFSSVAQLCLTLCNPMNHSVPGLPVHHQLPKSTQTHVHWGNDAIQPSHPLLSPSPLTFNLSQHQGLFKWVFSSGGQSIIGVSTSTSVLPMNTQDWPPLEWTGCISLQPKGLWRVFSKLHKIVHLCLLCGGNLYQAFA